MTQQTYRVLVDENFHFMDEDERYESGRYPTLELAEAHCREILDLDLSGMLRPDMSAQDLFECWMQFGDDPWIEGGTFSAVDYVRDQAEALCPE